MHPLASVLTGHVVTPADPGWDGARQAWNLAADQHPELVVVAEGVADVVETVAYARANGLRVAPQSTGHGALTMGGLAGTILLRTSRMTGVAIDPVARTARVEAGAQWHDVVGPAAEHGLAAPHGSSGTVGAVGYCMGGGLGWLGRSEGLAANLIVALDVVTADGVARRVDAAHEPDLFWALRGGGGGHAIVTALEIGLIELREAYAGQLLWPIESAVGVTAAYRAWTASLPDSVSSDLKLVRFPPLSDVPEPLRGKGFAAIALVARAGEYEGQGLVAPLLVDAGPPVLSTLDVVPAPALAAVAGDPPGPMPGIGGDGLLLRELDDEVAAAFVELAGPDVDVPLIHLELRHLGGALGRGDDAHGALDRLDGDFLLYAVGVPVTPEVGAAIGVTLDAVRERMAPFGTGSTVLAFAERQPGLTPSFPPETVERLIAVKAAYDPDGLIVASHTFE